MAPIRTVVTGGGIELDDTLDASASATSRLPKNGSLINSSLFTWPAWPMEND